MFVGSGVFGYLLRQAMFIAGATGGAGYANISVRLSSLLI